MYKRQVLNDAALADCTAVRERHVYQLPHAIESVDSLSLIHISEKRQRVHNKARVAEAALLRTLSGDKGAELGSLLLQPLQRGDACLLYTSRCV